MTHSFNSVNFKAQPYWWDEIPRTDIETLTLPDKTDVLIIGSGYTGLNCAIQTARAGRQTLVIDAETAGWGCSSRNGGQIGGEIKPGYENLRKRFGVDKAIALVKEARGALDWLGDFIESEAIDCEFRRCGRFLAAHNARQFNGLVKQVETQPKGLEHAMRIVQACDQAAEIDSEFYHGGVVIERHCSLNPAKYHQGLLELALRSGVEVLSNCQAVHIERNHSGFKVTTSRGVIQACEVVVATSAYTGEVAAWQRRRIIPIGSYMLATEVVDRSRLEKLIPADRVCSDTRKLVVYFRKSPDGKRLLFGGRVSVFETDPIKSLPALRQEMLRIFPQLENVQISHSWMGLVGFTFDFLPHIGKHDGLHYAMGYCGSGICLASYFGNRLGLQVLGKSEGDTAFNDLSFQSRPLYSGKPWFLGAAVRYYQLIDRMF